MVISPIPGELTGVVGGYVYGVSLGFLFSTVGLALGSWVAFELASIFGRPLVERFVRVNAWIRFRFSTTNVGSTVAFLLFLIPGFPKDYLCYVLGLTGMNLSTFLIVSTLGLHARDLSAYPARSEPQERAILYGYRHRVYFWCDCFPCISLSRRSPRMDKRHARKGYWPIRILDNRNLVYMQRTASGFHILDNFCFRVALEISKIVLYVSIRNNKSFRLSPCARPRST